MGLDIILDFGNKKTYLEMSEELHKYIFDSTKGYRNLKSLRKVSDYYKTDFTYSKENLAQLKKDISLILLQESGFVPKELINLEKRIDDIGLISIRFTGD